jgi:ribosomal-protein-alanine N-acetyltransferase
MTAPPPLPATLETGRLLLRPVVEADLPFFTELHADAEVVRFLGGDGEPRSPEATRAWFAKCARWCEVDRAGQYAVVLREEDRPIGRCGPSIFEVEREASAPDGIPLASWGVGSAPEDRLVRPVLELGYVVHRSAWGRGIAPEAASRWLEYLFEVRGEPHVTSIIHHENSASRRVAEKNGLVYAGTDVRIDGHVYGCHVLTAEAWRRR